LKIVTFSLEVRNAWRFTQRSDTLQRWCESERESSLIMCTASTYLWYHSPENVCQRTVDCELKGGYILSATLVWLLPPVRAQNSFLPVILFVCPDHPKATHQWQK
jgi:hypothetical protein